jgi:DNA-binding MarR family transcriptional regulator
MALANARSGEELLDQVLGLARRIHNELGSHDLTIRQFQALRALAGGPLRLGQLADAVEITGPSAVALVDALVTSGYAQRHPDPEDARASLIELTRKGMRRMRAAQAHVVEMLEGDVRPVPTRRRRR